MRNLQGQFWVVLSRFSLPSFLVKFQSSSVKLQSRLVKFSQSSQFKEVIEDKDAGISYRQEGGAKQQPKSGVY